MVFINETTVQENEEGTEKEGYLCFSHTDEGEVIKSMALESDCPNSSCLLLSVTFSTLTSPGLSFLICILGFIAIAMF